MNLTNDRNELKTVWPFGKFGHGYVLNPKQYRLYALAVRFMQITLFLSVIINLFLDSYLQSHLGWPKRAPILIASLIAILCFGAMHLITAHAPISQLAKSAPNYGKDPALLPFVSKARVIFGAVCGVFLVAFSALALLGEIVVSHKIEPGVLGIFLFSVAISIFLIRFIKRKKY